jgi:hypothetical protein
MEINMKASSKPIISKAMADTYGLMGENSRDSGKTIKCMERVPLFGQMAESMKVSMSTKRKKAMENLLGLMVDATRANGKTVSRTEKESIEISKASRSQAYGPTAKKLNGLIDINLL